MPALLADANAEGHLRLLVSLMQAEPWKEVWAELQMPVQTLAGVGLRHDVSDVQLWNACQSGDLLLITGNRNQEGEDSLESVIRRANQPSSLPVVTLASPDRLSRDRAYADLAVERLLEKLIDLDRYRGAGRIYLP